MDPKDAPADLASVRVEFPPDLKIERLNSASLPPAWRRTPAPQELWEIGVNWLNTASSVGLLVPSAVIPEDLNVLINPAHADFRDLIFSEPVKFSFDSRIRQNLCLKSAARSVSARPRGPCAFPLRFPKTFKRAKPT